MADKTQNSNSPPRGQTDPDTEESTSDYLSRHVRNQSDLRNAIAFLIHRRELLRDCEIEVLEHHCDKLIEQIADTKHRILLEELECFKEVIALHRRILGDDKS